MPTATAAVLSANHEPFVLEEIEVESPQRDEVLVRIVATGLCHTDLSAREGLIPFPLPGVLGHEGAGVVEEIGDDVTDRARYLVRWREDGRQRARRFQTEAEADAFDASVNPAGRCQSCRRHEIAGQRHATPSRTSRLLRSRLAVA